MNDDKLDDLKQFIDSRISQSEALLKSELASKADLERLEKKLEKRMDDGFAGAGEAFDQLGEQLAKRDAEVDKRLALLEQQAA